MGHLSWGCPLNASKQSSMPAHVVAALQSWHRSFLQPYFQRLDIHQQVLPKLQVKDIGVIIQNTREFAFMRRGEAKLDGIGNLSVENSDRSHDTTSLRREAHAGCATTSRTPPGRQLRGHRRRRDDWSSGNERNLTATDRRRRGCNEAPGRHETNEETSGTTGVYTGPSARDDSRRQTDGSEDKEEERMHTEPCDDEKGTYAEPSNEESSCRQTEPNTSDASASPDGDSLAPRGAASVLSWTQSRVRGKLATFPEEPSDAQEPEAPSRDSNQVLGRLYPVMACSGAGTVSAITVGSTWTGLTLSPGEIWPDFPILNMGISKNSTSQSGSSGRQVLSNQHQMGVR
ncbi:hypothetical protein H257_04692 [Aphanomyces astaci]|uniref:Uncharacterized protein n=1 Tax=Aphanomyces astaci TaxID=112090 RepID=W4GT83_APHAT|nr:hypothetical protein H257_04692 [Aphanomyces astaci]ETV82922.1 hypothetical protein H257_04692 [Aphanomyces astaci]|eukprot:XP_009827593.1 hypothetical protein H257_04692 [Aphanomyces astaci]